MSGSPMTNNGVMSDIYIHTNIHACHPFHRTPRGTSGVIPLQYFFSR